MSIEKVKTINPFTDVDPIQDDKTKGEKAPQALENLTSIQMGFGSKVMRADERGLWLGGVDFTDAPFSVDMLGNVIMSSATISGYKLFEAVVGTTNADYTSVSAALADGNKRIFVRNGTYTNESAWSITDDDTIIVGESYGGVDIQFGSDGNQIVISAEYVTLDKLKLTAYNTAYRKLISFTTGAKYPHISNLILRNDRGEYIDGGGINYLNGIFSNIYFDYTNKVIIGSDEFLNNIYHCDFYNLFVDYDITGSPQILDGVYYSNIANGKIIMPDTRDGFFSVNAVSTSSFINCFFRIKEIVLSANAINCIFQSNGQYSSGGWFIQLSGASLNFLGNRVIAKANTDDIRIFIGVGALQNIQNNYFENGGLIQLSHSTVDLKGGTFSNNVWRAYASASASAGYDAELTLNSHILNWNVVYNIIRNNNSGGAVPSITDSGTGNNTTGNQLFKN